MNLGRRQFLGAFAGTAATLLYPRSAANAVVPAHDRWGPLGNGVLPHSTIEQPAIANAPALLPRALAALDAHGGRIAARDMIGIVDFSAPSRTPRFFLVDLEAGKVASTHLVAHGKGSDPANSGWVEHLSNRPGSEASCSGSFLTGQTYVGKHGRSRKLLGLDAENSMALDRGIVIHAASYVDAGMAADLGRIGRSQGCFAVSQSEISKVLERLGPGRLIYAAR
ncbi:murein L,D-transpeptidase catalytic domain family protein [Novosphingobium cyanobacteriorum]|uniref:Murein L,D-transpeptidase catalytic domain family protein n=1 Tax=Novosphingobium cyanobacteriorum TaxID=3024215 RepID=A0ABT6CF86_9SPHN|nr:murein L,D-transpeptidase catalytic domain family protein [Novosphingobium cyanobacteriorum]MDF8332446.1 murein L,D-transpeptidase catalytic domain family protein [Novosphingobium cyanobacteriorum]